MEDGQKIDPAPAPDIKPLHVTIVGTGDGRSDATSITSGTVATTPPAMQNVVFNVVNPLVAIVVRFANDYFTMLVGLLLAGMTTNIIPAADFGHLFEKCLGLSLAGPAIGALKNVTTIFGKLEGKFPLLTGNV